MNDLSPDKIKKFELINTNRNFELAKLNLDREEFKYNKLSFNSKNLHERIIYSNPEINESFNYNYQPKISYPAIFWKLEPALQSSIGGPDRFFVGGLVLRAESEVIFNNNTTLSSVIRYDLVNTFDTLDQGSDSILPKVRTNISEYLRLKNDLAIARMQANQFYHFRKGIYAKLSAGIFEEMFAGFGGEILFKDFNSNKALGIELYNVRQRDFKQDFKLQDYDVLTGHVTYYQEIPSIQTLIKLSGGRYLAKDSGVTIDVSRRFESGLRMAFLLQRLI